MRVRQQSTCRMYGIKLWRSVQKLKRSATLTKFLRGGAPRNSREILGRDPYLSHAIPCAPPLASNQAHPRGNDASLGALHELQRLQHLRRRRRSRWEVALPLGRLALALHRHVVERRCEVVELALRDPERAPRVLGLPGRVPGWSDAAKSSTWAASGWKATASRRSLRRWASPHECGGQPQAFGCRLTSPWRPAMASPRRPCDHPVVLARPVEGRLHRRVIVLVALGAAHLGGAAAELEREAREEVARLG